MWLSKFLDLEGDFSEEIKAKIIQSLDRKKLTPLEFTVLEILFNVKKISTEDLIRKLNDHFAGSFEAKAGTIKPILSKLKKKGFLGAKKEPSPLGPLKKVYWVTDAGREILQTNVSRNFEDQVEYIRNFLIELVAIYIQSVPEKERETKLLEAQTLLDNAFSSIKTTVFVRIVLGGECPDCGQQLQGDNSNFCSNCGFKLKEIIEIERGYEE
jgi:DNA-binding PadR family transcriptional regulator